MVRDRFRRRFLKTVGAVTTAGLAGCTGSPDSRDGRYEGTATDTPTETTRGTTSGGGSVVLEGATTYDDEWTVGLDAGTNYELELTQSDGIFATVGVQRLSDANIVAHLDTEERETIGTRFTVPSSDEYLVILQVNGDESPRGNASFVIRTV